MSDYESEPNPPSQLWGVIKNWLWFDLFFSIILYAHLGTEGMAKLACEVIEHEVCADLEYP